MKRLILFSILAWIGIGSALASHNDLLNLCRSMNYSTYQKGLEELIKGNENPHHRYERKLLIKNEICPKYWQEAARVELLITDPNDPLNFEHHLFRIKLFYKDAKIMYYRLEELEDGGTRIVNFWHDKSIVLMDSLSQSFEETFGAGFIGATWFEEGYVYGMTCGVHGRLTPLRKELQTIMENDDRASLLAWMRSGVIEKQLYAIEGLLEMQHEGQVLENQTIKAMEWLKTRDGVAMQCTGNRQALVNVKSLIDPIFNRYASD